MRERFDIEELNETWGAVLRGVIFEKEEEGTWEMERGVRETVALREEEEEKACCLEGGIEETGRGGTGEVE